MILPPSFWVFRSFSNSAPHSWTLKKKHKISLRWPPSSSGYNPRSRRLTLSLLYTENNSLPGYKPIINLLSSRNLYGSPSIWSRPTFLQFHQVLDWQNPVAPDGKRSWDQSWWNPFWAFFGFAPHWATRRMPWKMCIKLLKHFHSRWQWRHNKMENKLDIGKQERDINTLK